MKHMIAFLLLWSSASAGEVCIRTEMITPGYCTPSGCPPDTITRGYGTGVVVGKTKADYWVILTAKHVVEGSQRQWIADGKGWLPVNSVYELETNDDAAFLTVDMKEALNAAPIAEEDAPQGESIHYSGYAGGQMHESTNGVVTEFGGSLNTARCDVRPRQGMSGGGVYDRRGRLIGIVSGYDNHGNLVYCPIGRVRRASMNRWGFFFGMGVVPIVPYYPPPQPPRPPNVVPGPPMKVAPLPPVTEQPDAPAPFEPVKPLPDPVSDVSVAKIAELEKQIAELKAASGNGCKCDATKGCKCDPAKQTTTLQILAADGKVIDSATYVGPNPVLKLKLVPKAKAK